MKKLVATLLICIAFGFGYCQSVQDSLLQSGRKAYQGGEYAQAIAYYREYLRLAEEADDLHAIADAYRLIGDAFRAVGELEEAMDQLERGLQIAQESNDSSEIARIYDRIAAVRYEKQDMLGTELASQNAMSVATKINDQSTVSSTLNILGAMYRSVGKPQKALDALSRSVAIQRTMGDTTDIPNALNNIAHTLIGMGKYEQAVDTALKSFAMAKSMNILVYQNYAALMLTQAFRATKSYEKALEWMETYNGLNVAITNEAKGKEISNLRQEMKMAQKEKDYEILKQQNILQKQTIDSQEAMTLAFIGIGVLSVILMVLAIFLALQAHRRKQAITDLRTKNARIEQQTQEISLINERLERVGLEREFQKGRLEEINKVKDKLFSIISHDLRSPLNSIQGMLQLIQSKMLSMNEFEHMADTLKTRVDNTTLLLDNLLNWSRSQMEGFSVKLEQINVGDLVDVECRLLDSTAKMKGIQIENRISPDTIVLGDRNMIELVVRNLLANAIKFTESNGHVYMQAKAAQHTIHIGVTDNGVGIPESMMPRVLGQDYFSTVGTAKEKGSGLGLRLCKEFLQRNSGEFWLERNAEQGMTFWFSLPQAA